MAHATRYYTQGWTAKVTEKSSLKNKTTPRIFLILGVHLRRLAE